MGEWIDADASSMVQVEAGCVKLMPITEQALFLDPADAVRIANALLQAAARAEGERRFFAESQRRQLSAHRAIYR